MKKLLILIFTPLCTFAMEQTNAINPLHEHLLLLNTQNSSNETIQYHLFNSGQELFIAEKVSSPTNPDKYEPIKLLLKSPSCGYFSNALLASLIEPKPQYYNDHYLECSTKSLVNFLASKITTKVPFFNVTQFKKFSYCPNKQLIVCIQHAPPSLSQKEELGVWILTLQPDLLEVKECSYYKVPLSLTYPENDSQVKLEINTVETETNTGTEIRITIGSERYSYNVPAYSLFKQNILAYKSYQQNKELICVEKKA